jgi:beta-lactamase class A
MNRKIILFIVLLCGLYVNNAFAQLYTIRPQLKKLLTETTARVGVAVIDLQTNDTITFGGNERYSMQSVYKFHLAMTALNWVDAGKLKLNDRIWIKDNDLLPNMWSPMREAYINGERCFDLAGLIRYAVSESDNNACDILFKILGGPKTVNDYIHSLGINDTWISATEEEMHQHWITQFINWTTPMAMAQLLEKFYKGKLFSKSSQYFLWETMVNTSTGKNRIKGLLPVDAIVAHKTGTSGIGKNGIIDAINDVGVVQLPNGKSFVLVVLVANSPDKAEVSERLIANIGKELYGCFLK